MNEKYRLWKDGNNLIIQRRRALKSEERWDNIAFYSPTKPHLAVGRLLSLMTDEGSFEGDAQTIVDRIERALEEGIERLTALMISAENPTS